MVESFLASVKGDVQVVPQPDASLLLVHLASKIQARTHYTHPLLNRQHRLMHTLLLIGSIRKEVAAEMEGGVEQDRGGQGQLKGG